MTITIDFVSMGIGFVAGVASFGLYLTIVLSAGN